MTVRNTFAFQRALKPFNTTYTRIERALQIADVILNLPGDLGHLVAVIDYDAKEWQIPVTIFTLDTKGNPSMVSGIDRANVAKYDDIYDACIKVLSSIAKAYEPVS